MKEIFEKLSAERCPDGIGSTKSAGIVGQVRIFNHHNRAYDARSGLQPKRCRI